MDALVRSVTLRVHREIVQRTPVDTGMARNNWQIGIGRRPEGIVAELSKNGAYAINAAMSLAPEIRAGGVNYIVNNLHYIVRLEFGYSRQAPGGMARLTVDRWQKMVGEAVKGGATK
jgi:hypothetical protein